MQWSVLCCRFVCFLSFQTKVQAIPIHDSSNVKHNSTTRNGHDHPKVRSQMLYAPVDAPAKYFMVISVPPFVVLLAVSAPSAPSRISTEDANTHTHTQHIHNHHCTSHTITAKFSPTIEVFEYESICTVIHCLAVR